LANQSGRAGKTIASGSVMNGMLELAQDAGVRVLPVYAVSENPSATILDLAATQGWIC
jgi:hypothetical protein